MAYTKDKVRLTVAVSQELNDKIEKLANAMHLSKTALVITMIEQNIDLMAAGWNMINNPEFRSTLLNAAKENNMDTSQIEAFNNLADDNPDAVEGVTNLFNEIKTK